MLVFSFIKTAILEFYMDIMSQSCQIPVYLHYVIPNMQLDTQIIIQCHIVSEYTTIWDFNNIYVPMKLNYNSTSPKASKKIQIIAKLVSKAVILYLCRIIMSPYLAETYLFRLYDSQNILLYINIIILLQLVSMKCQNIAHFHLKGSHL